MDFTAYNQMLDRRQVGGRAYLFMGDENYMMQNMANKTQEVLLQPAMRPLNAMELSATQLNMAKLDDMILTLPVMDVFRVIVIKHADVITGMAGEDRLYELLPQLPPEVVLILIDTYGGVKKTTKLYKRLKKVDGIVEFKTLTPQQFHGFVRAQLRPYQMDVTPQVSRELMDRSGYGAYGSELSLFDLKQALDKVVLAASPGQLPLETFLPFWPRDPRAGIFTMIDAMSAGNLKEVKRNYDELHRQKEPAMRMLAMISRHLRLWRKMQDLKAARYGPADSKEALGIKDFEYRKLSRLPKRQDLDELLRLVEETELALKSTGGDMDIRFETMLLQLTEKLGHRPEKNY